MCREVGAESVLVPIRDNVASLESVFILTPVAARIWTLLDRAVAPAQLAGVLCDEFEIDEETASTDVIELLASLEEASLVNRIHA